MTKQVLATNSYFKLVAQLKKIFIEGMQRIEEEKVKTYWRTGEIILNYILEQKERADYGDNLFEKLSGDLGIQESTLQRSVRFYRANPILAALPKLSWLHQLQLITIKDEGRRKLFAQRAAKKSWGYRELSEAIRLDRLKIEEPEEGPEGIEWRPRKKLSFLRGKLYTYQVLEPSYIHSVEEHLIIDLGFKFLIHTEIRGIRLKAQEIIESIKEPATKIGGFSGYSFKHSDAAPKELYTYKALIEKVVDGDTLWLNIDVGFSCWSRQKVRLRGIDASEIDTQKGKEAKEFVEARLKEVDFVIVKTHKSDKYDRYLADIFYFKDQAEPQKALEEGMFLNQELLDTGLARVMND